MAIEEPGVLWRDGVYFYAASNFAKQHLFYPMWGATYELDSPYRIRRDYMDAYMIQYVARGALHFKLRGHHFVAKEGELVLLACREKNDYWSEGTARSSGSTSTDARWDPCWNASTRRMARAI